MRLLDLFAGIGGFSLAAHWMGWETAAFVERDKFCQKVLRKNFGQEIEIHDDICTFSGKPFRGAVDIITGGFPCQPFSAAGKRKGRADERHLFPEMLRVISEVRPRWVVAENVRGLLSIESGSVFTEVVASLEGEDYEVITFCVPASAVEAPHRRDRLWFVALDTEHAQRYGLPTGSIVRSVGKAAGKQSTGANTAADVAGTDSVATNARDTRLQRGEQSGTLGEGTRASRSVTERDCDVEDAGRKYGTRQNVGRQSSIADKSRNVYEPQRSVAREGDGWRESWLEAAARLCRVDDVVPNRVDRLKSLGNAIVPQVAYEIFRAIEAAENA